MIVVMSPEVFGHQRVGGISRYFVELERELRALGVDVRTLAGAHINSYLDELPGTIGWRHPGQRTPRWLRAANEALFRSWCATTAGHVVAHRTYYDWPQRPRCARLVTTIHDLIPELLGGDRPPDAHSLRKRRACEECDAICVNSRTTSRDLQRLWGVPEERIWITPLGVRTTEPSPCDWRIRFGRYLLHVGHREGYKNARMLFRAFACSGLARDTSIVCFGGGAPRASECALLDELRIRDHVHFLEGTDKDLSACYRDAIGHVCPSLYEGFGLTVLEAMARGCPVACSRAGALPEVVGDAAVLFEPSCVDSTVHALTMLAAGGSVIGALAARGRLRADAFSWKATAQRTLMAYTGMRADSCQ